MQTELAAIESRLRSEIDKRLAVIEAGLVQQLNDLTAQSATHFTDNLAEAQRRLDHKIVETQNLLGHCRIDEETRKADEQLRHPRPARR